jgi:hypothetical protein
VAGVKGGISRLLDLKASAVRIAVREASDAETLYLSDVATSYG